MNELLALQIIIVILALPLIFNILKGIKRQFKLFRVRKANKKFIKKQTKKQVKTTRAKKDILEAQRLGISYDNYMKIKSKLK